MKTISQTIFLLLISLVSYSQELSGQWNGKLSVQDVELRIVFHIIKAEGKYTATLDSPDQNAKDIPVTSVSLGSPDVKIEISNIGMVFEGTLDGNKISGKWAQSGRTFPLELLRQEKESKK
ncbi:hypothetical protein WSM22_31610 [Cytophagales bacterium WSM2-2]|nr:hypothetical protein WSM22_31610 [Cytophagales bacterium WSM2-2]